MTAATITISLSDYNELKASVSRQWERGYEAGLDTARRDFAEVNAHKNELLRSVEVLEGLLAEARRAAGRTE